MYMNVHAIRIEYTYTESMCVYGGTYMQVRAQGKELNSILPG